MALNTKYQPLINFANQHGASNLQAKEAGGVLHIDANVPSEEVKRQIWDEYNRIDPDYRSGDLILNLMIVGGNTTTSTSQVYEVKSGDNLSAIAKNYGLTWQEIYEANRDVVKDPDLIQPGWKLKIPKK